MTVKKALSIWTGQTLHFACLVFLIAAVWATWAQLGEPFPIAFWVAIVIPIIHQIYVWLAWRLELLSSATSEAIGFRGYLVCFFLLFGGRFLALFALAWMDHGSLGFEILPRIAITSVLVGLGAYAMYSVVRFFGMARAAGADHFDARYRDMPLVNQGIFGLTSNGMYVYAFLLFWAIAVGFDSAAALVVAGLATHIFGCTSMPPRNPIWTTFTRLVDSSWGANNNVRG